jgi:hypothetical protein
MRGSLSARRPSPAMIVALIALFAALGGTGYAALKLPKNSVSAKQIKKNAVTTPKIKKNAVTGAKIRKGTINGSDINIATLGTVPSAAAANSVPPLEGTHLVGTAGEPPFEGGSSNFGSVEGLNTQAVGYFKDREGVVHLQGLANVGPGPVPVIFSLPPGFRPASGQILFFNTFCSGTTCSGEGNGQLLVAGSNVFLPGFAFNGAVLANTEATVSLDGISFRAAN